MTIGTSPIGSLPIGTSVTVVTTASDEIGLTEQLVTMAFTTDAQINAVSSDLWFEALMGFVCDCEVLSGVGDVVQKPTAWTSDSSVTTTWIPDNPIKGV